MSSLKRGRHRDAIDRAMEQAVRLGGFIDYNASWSFVTELEEVAEQIEQLLPEEAERAVALYETFIAACYEKAEEIDDSSGNLGMFVENLFCGWIRARQAAQSDGEKTIERLLSWMDKDDYGFFYQLETEAVKVLDRDGLRHFASQVQKRFDAADQPSKLQNEDGRTQQDTSYRQRYWSGVLKTIYAAQNNVDAYVVLCRETELLPRKENWCNRTTRFFCKKMKHLIKQMNRLFPKVKKLIVHAKIQGKGDHFGIGAVPMRTEQAR